MRDSELELEFESQSEPFLGDVVKGIGGMFGLGESEDEYETLGEGPLGEGPLGEGPLGEGPLGEGPLGEGPLGEYEDEQFLGGLLKGVGGMLGLGESEDFSDHEAFGDQESEQFFGKFLKKALPILKQVAKVAAPIVGSAVGGPIGGKIASAAAGLLGESEYEDFSDHEAESTNEAEMEAVMEGPLTEQQALGELMAAAASKAFTDMESEAQIAAGTIMALSAADRDALRAVLPSLNRGVAILNRILRRRRITRPVIRVIPTIVKRTAVTLKKRADAGLPVTKKIAARTMAAQTRRVLASPTLCRKAIHRNVRATQAVGRKIRSQQPRRYAY
jgi:hypothetical protein